MELKNSFPLQSWMGSCAAVKSLTPMEFCFPGTHDTGSYEKPNFGPIVSDSWMSKSDLRFLPTFQEVAARWSVSQPNCSVYTQLMNGVRFLDLRVAYTVYEGKPSYFLVHTFAMSRLDDVINDIKRFVTSHPTELILMNVEPYYQIQDPTLQKIFEDKLGEWMYLNAHGASTITETISSILQANKRIVGIYRYQKPATGKLWFSKHDMFAAGLKFVSLDTVAKKQAYLKKGVEEYAAKPHNPPKLYQLSYTLTEVGIDVAESLFTGESLAILADKMNPTLLSFLHHQLTAKERSVINVITCDHEDHSNVVDVCLYLLQERNSARLAALAGPARHQSRRQSRLSRLCCCCAGEEEDHCAPLLNSVPDSW